MLMPQTTIDVIDERGKKHMKNLKFNLQWLDTPRLKKGIFGCADHQVQF